jgi:hypothetical protein
MRIKEGGGPMRVVGKGGLIFKSFACVYYVFLHEVAHI